ncbi:DUF2061 domain-containing protein [Marixanthomonas spongiae]|uniref:DUF2061 domain-containing protein n=1 Tax=Marixanthomonas spongiae TaxID=2174845 RepID=A0A2U0I3V3_9FLAO|nr:DUF2061 domain-containing protein [Marixanthomonas spongiae]PVW15768.1 hypothetical protein DDV96_05730 [Marixanthomonas spongiae]
MATYKKESHYRSILKGVSWRCIATADTFLVVLVITCLNGTCSIDSAIKIGFLEFFVKLAVYYLHERIWQKILFGKEVKPKQTLYKTISWRILATTGTFIISGVVLEKFGEIALYIALAELVSKFILYYLHERMWLRLPLGRVRHLFSTKKN